MLHVSNLALHYFLRSLTFPGCSEITYTDYFFLSIIMYRFYWPGHAKCFFFFFPAIWRIWLGKRSAGFAKKVSALLSLEICDWWSITVMHLSSLLHWLFWPLIFFSFLCFSPHVTALNGADRHVSCSILVLLLCNF